MLVRVSSCYLSNMLTNYQSSISSPPRWWTEITIINMFNLILNNTDKNKYTKSYVFLYSLRYIHISGISPKITKKKSTANSVAVYEAPF